MYRQHAHFSIVSNIFYIIPMIPAFIFRWFYLFLIYLCVIITSTTYHVCENLNICAFGWEIITWRKLDHIFAWYGIAISFVHVFLPEIYLSYKGNLSIFHNGIYNRFAKNKNIHHKHDKIRDTYYTLLQFFLAFVNVLLLVEIIYFSNGMIDSFPLPQIIIFASMILGVLGIRIIIYKILYIENKKTSYCPKFKNISFLILSIPVLILASLFFVIKEDPDSIIHGLWHYFGSLTGGLLLLSLY